MADDPRAVAHHNQQVVASIIAHNKSLQSDGVRHAQEKSRVLAKDAISSLLTKPAMNMEQAAKRVAEVKAYYGE